MSPEQKQARQAARVAADALEQAGLTMEAVLVRSVASGLVRYLEQHKEAEWRHLLTVRAEVLVRDDMEPL